LYRIGSLYGCQSVPLALSLTCPPLVLILERQTIGASDRGILFQEFCVPDFLIFLYVKILIFAVFSLILERK